MGRVCISHWRDDKRTEKVWWDNLRRVLGADRRILLKCISNITG